MEYYLKAFVAKTRRYVLTLPEELRDVCRFGHINCARFALGENQCEEEADHYIFKYLCAAACRTCEKFADPDERASVELHYKEAVDEAQQFWEYHQQKAKYESGEELLDEEWY